MILDSFKPLKAEKFLRSAFEYVEPLKGTYIYDAITRDYMEKTGIKDAGYGKWLNDLLAYLSQRYELSGKRVLDFGCGSGELTVCMRTLGYEAYGIDLHETHLSLARILAVENGVPPEAFVLNRPNGTPEVKLPFPDASFDVITLFSVVEHLNDAALARLLPEFRRVCRGVVYVLVPNRLKPIDDHTGLRLVCWMPRCMAVPYVRLRGRRSGYHISSDGTWDVYNRTLSRVVRLYRKGGFEVEYPPDHVIFPPLQANQPIKEIGKHFTFGGRRFYFRINLPYQTMMKMGYPQQYFYPYLNLLFLPPKKA